jgi:hypothetical protein
VRNIRSPDCECWWWFGAVGSLAVRMEAGDFHGLTLDCCLPSRRLAGALEERSFTREIPYHSRFSNSQGFLILFCKENGTNPRLCGLVIHNLQNGAIGTLPIANEVITYDCCGRNPWSFLHNVGAVDRKRQRESSAHYGGIQLAGKVK